MESNGKFTVGRVLDGLVAVCAATRAGVSKRQLSEWVGVSIPCIENWLKFRHIPDGSYLPAIEARVAPVVRDAIHKYKVDILVDFDKSGLGKEIEKVIAQSRYGHAAAQSASLKNGVARRGGKYRPETIEDRSALAKKVKWIVSTLGRPHSHVAEMLGVSASAVSSWVAGRSTPNLTYTEKIGSLHKELRAQRASDLRCAGVPESTVLPENGGRDPLPAPQRIEPPPPRPVIIDAGVGEATIAYDAKGAIVFLPVGRILAVERGEFFALRSVGPIAQVTIPVGGECRVRVRE